MQVCRLQAVFLSPLRDENHMVDSYVYAKNSTGTPPTGPQVTTAKGNLTITATDNAKPTNFGGVLWTYANVLGTRQQQFWQHSPLLTRLVC